MKGVEPVVLFNPAAFETPESVQIDRRGNTYISMALTGGIRKIAPNGTQSRLAFLPIRPDVQPCGNSLGIPIILTLFLLCCLDRQCSTMKPARRRSALPGFHGLAATLRAAAQFPGRNAPSQPHA